MRLYIYNENCTSKGQIANSVDDSTAALIDKLEQDGDTAELESWEQELGFGFGDCHYREGTEDELIAEARKSLRIRYDTRPGGAGDSYRWLCDRRVLKYLGADRS